MDGVNPDTVWTWNAIGKRAGAWGLAPDAPEAKRGFLLNHLITELLPERDGGYRYLQQPIPSPARPPGTTCGCASRRPQPTSDLGRSSRPSTPSSGLQPRPATRR